MASNGSDVWRDVPTCDGCARRRLHLHLRRAEAEPRASATCGQQRERQRSAASASWEAAPKRKDGRATRADRDRRRPCRQPPYTASTVRGGRGSVAADSVTITSPVHPLAGRVVAVVRWVRLRDGRRYVDVRRPDGSVLRLPLDLTDRASPCGAMAGARVSPSGLLRLASAVAASQADGQKVDESARAELTGVQPEQMRSSHVGSPGETRPGCAARAGASAADGDPGGDRGVGDTGSQAVVRPRR